MKKSLFIKLFVEVDWSSPNKRSIQIQGGVWHCSYKCWNFLERIAGGENDSWRSAHVEKADNDLRSSHDGRTMRPLIGSLIVVSCILYCSVRNLKSSFLLSMFIIILFNTDKSSEYHLISRREAPALQFEIRSAWHQVCIASGVYSIRCV